MTRQVALVTDSTASLPTEVVRDRDIRVVPLQVVIGAHPYDEGTPDGATPEMVAEALREWKPVSTSRPSPQAMLTAYREAEKAGAEEVVSVHLSGDMSGTFESAQVAARDAPVPVLPVDSRQLGMATGFAVITAADLLDAGGTAEQAAAAAQSRAAATTTLFYVDTLEYLRRGGRIGAATAMLGSAIRVKPLLGVRDGLIVPTEKVRTASRALARLTELAVQAAGEEQVEVAVAHLANPERAAGLAETLTDRLATNLAGCEVAVGEVGGVLGAHVGPGMVAAVVSPRPHGA